ncbi:MAG: nucleotidyl transferase AbiEii/AbiGii toxin family protein [Deltaproteobacteria bacterium]|nr:nucleotidyl transferase AbiEii/AbiGii toxin family protein [Deltaproteobacteria bacterium]
MENREKPDAALARRVLPGPLHECLVNIFSQGIDGTALVGGTALAGYYFGHRRSDDIDLFSQSPAAFRAAVLAVKHLEKRDVVLSNLSQSAQYFHANCTFRDHSFTVDVVLDENLFKVGSFKIVKGEVLVPSLETILRMKIATLVSIPAEKDLYDLKWIFKQ